MHPWYAVLILVVAAVGAAAYLSECALCRRERARSTRR